MIAGASIARITVFVCSGGQGATVRVQSITALSLSFDFLTQSNNLTIIKHIITK